MRVLPPERTDIEVRFTIGTKTLVFPSWDLDAIIAGWLASDIPEFAEIIPSKSGDALLLTMPQNSDFVVGLSMSAAVAITTVVEGASPSPQKVLISLPTQKVFQGRTQAEWDVYSPGTYDSDWWETNVNSLTDVAQSTGGTWDLTINWGSGDETATSIAYNVTAAALQTAIEGMTTPVSGDILVNYLENQTYELTFDGNFDGIGVVSISADGDDLTGNAIATVETIQNSGSAAPQLFTIALDNTDITPNGEDFTCESITPMHETSWSYGWTASTVAGGTAGIAGLLESMGITDDLYEITAYEDNYLATTWVIKNYSAIEIYSLWFGNIHDGKTHHAKEYLEFGGTDNNPIMLHMLSTASTSPSWFGSVTYNSQTWVDDGADYGSSSFRANLEDDIEALSSIGVGNVEVNSSGSSATGVYSRMARGTVYHMKGTFANTVVDDTLWSVTNGTITLIHQGAAEVNEKQRIAISGGIDGTFTLSWDGETTSALNHDDSAATVETELELFTSIAAGDIAVIDNAESDWTIEFLQAYLYTDVNLMTIDASSVTGGTIADAETQAAIAGVNEVQRVELVGTPTGGDFRLKMYDESSSAIDYDDDAAAFATAIETWSHMTASDNTVNKTGDFAWTITFEGDLGWQALPEMELDENNLLTANSFSAITFDSVGTGPEWYSEPKNWSLGRVPDSGDDVVFEKPNTPVMYGLKQLGEFTADADSDSLSISEHGFQQAQIVRLTTSDTLPAGLAINTDYYVINSSRSGAALQLAATEGGTAIDITDTGTGTHYVGVRLNSLEIRNRHNKAIGLSDRNTSKSQPYEEYREQYLSIGFLPTGDKKVTIGAGDGAGSGRLKLDFGKDAVDIKILNSGGSIEAAVPAIVLNIDNALAELDVDQGEVGVAYFSDQAFSLYAIIQSGGLIRMGEGNLSGFQDRTGGEFLARQMTMLADSYIISR